MSRSRKKLYARDGSSEPWVRRLTRHRMKTPRYADAPFKKVVNTWIFHDWTCHESCRAEELREIRERYQKERRRVESGRHPLCIRLGKEKALRELSSMEERELFRRFKCFRLKG